jgi:hypothetical protein
MPSPEAHLGVPRTPCPMQRPHATPPICVPRPAPRPCPLPSPCNPPPSPSPTPRRCGWRCSASTTWTGWTWPSPPCSTCSRSSRRWVGGAGGGAGVLKWGGGCVCVCVFGEVGRRAGCARWQRGGASEVAGRSGYGSNRKGPWGQRCTRLPLVRLPHPPTTPRIRGATRFTPHSTRFTPHCPPPAAPPQHKEEVHRGQLSSFGIPADLAAQPMYTLSGGWPVR